MTPVTSASTIGRLLSAAKRACETADPALSLGTRGSTDTRRPGDFRIAQGKQSSRSLEPTRLDVVLSGSAQLKSWDARVVRVRTES